TKKEETVQDLHLSYQNASGNTSSGDTTQNYYFTPFIITDENSKAMYGLHPAPQDLQDDRFKDPESMARYARSQFVSEPKISIEVVMDTNEMPIPGETKYLTIQ
ncbi:hypothetical protein, partial [Bartonella sp. CL71SXKL]|uniref:hypothetical protein n=1 Tax=Bartonella sp. CL71SXKL TaxID=3243540 RepID=UPI0035D11DB7